MTLKPTHLDETGAAHMVDVGAKPATERRAVAGGRIAMSPAALEAIRSGNAPKGDVLSTARIAGIMAAKRTADLIPLCHPLALTKLSVEFEWLADGIAVRATAATTGPTGVEMEALTAASVALLTLYDMAKALDRAMILGDIRLLEKSGGALGRLARRMNGLLPVEEAQARLLALRAPLASENILFPQSAGRYLSQDIVAQRDQPAAPLSAMDGYAIRFADLPGPWTIAGEVAAGAVPAAPLGAGQAMRIFTGAMVPDGADTVVMQEDVAVDGTRLALATADAIRDRQHVRGRASDFAAGDRLIPAGSRLTPGAIAAAIMSGAGQLAVGGRPRVAILTTGDELVQAGRMPAPGQIPDSNGIMLAAMLAGEAAEVGLPLHIGDDRAKISAALKTLARRHDVIVTVGGASVGDHDHVRAALADAGGRLDFWKIAMKPGKPLIAGTVGDALLLGLPGNPASAFVTATLFLLPLVRHLAGASAPFPAVQRAPLADALTDGGKRRDYLRARLDDGRLRIFGGQDSGRTFPLGGANALVIRDIGAPARAAGDMADFIAIA